MRKGNSMKNKIQKHRKINDGDDEFIKRKS